MPLRVCQAEHHQDLQRARRLLSLRMDAQGHERPNAELSALSSRSLRQRFLRSHSRPRRSIAKRQRNRSLNHQTLLNHRGHRDLSLCNEMHIDPYFPAGRRSFQRRRLGAEALAKATPLRRSPAERRGPGRRSFQRRRHHLTSSTIISQLLGAEALAKETSTAGRLRGQTLFICFPVSPLQIDKMRNVVPGPHSHSRRQFCASSWEFPDAAPICDEN